MLIDVHRSDDMGNVYTLKEPLYYRELTVPVGFRSDGASVPRFFWRLVFPPGDVQAMRAAFLHDFIYRTHPGGNVPLRNVAAAGADAPTRLDREPRRDNGAARNTEADVRWTRKKADDLFYDVLVADGVPKWRARLAWAGVRIGGAAAWNAGGKHDDV